jgi:hypothetical protein
MFPEGCSMFLMDAECSLMSETGGERRDNNAECSLKAAECSLMDAECALMSETGGERRDNRESERAKPHVARDHQATKG